MFLSIRKIRNQRYLYLLETVPGKKKGTHTNRIVKNLGNFDKLPEEVRNAYLDKKAKRELAKHGISCEGKRAVQITKADYGKYDYILGMEERNIRNILRIVGKDPEGKVKLLLDYSDNPRDIADPWYTRDFESTYRDVVEGCEGFLAYLEKNEKI